MSLICCLVSPTWTPTVATGSALWAHRPPAPFPWMLLYGLGTSWRVKKVLFFSIFSGTGFPAPPPAELTTRLGWGREVAGHQKDSVFLPSWRESWPGYCYVHTQRRACAHEVFPCSPKCVRESKMQGFPIGKEARRLCSLLTHRAFPVHHSLGGRAE